MEPTLATPVMIEVSTSGTMSIFSSARKMSATKVNGATALALGLSGAKATVTATAPPMGSTSPAAAAAALPVGTNHRTSPFERSLTTPSARSVALPSSMRRSSAEPRATKAASNSRPGDRPALAPGLRLATPVTATPPSTPVTLRPE